MIDWRLVLGALAGGLALTCWLESRYRLGRSTERLVRLLQGTAVFLAVAAASLFTYAYANPLWPQPVPPRTVVAAAVPLSPRFTPSPLVPPSVFVMATATPQTGALPALQDNMPPETAFLHIPDLGVSQPIVDLPLANGRWDVSALGERVGRLDSTGAYPGDTLAPVFAGHMTFPASATLATGAFANLQYATYGTELIYEVDGQKIVYSVTEISRVAPEEVERLYLADGDSILLVTCTDWDADGRIYASRLLVRAVRTN